MERNLLIAGFGGQGIMLLGKLLAYSACDTTEKNVTFFPSYGAEQRGGTANCYVVISDEMIGAPVGDVMEDLIIMNGPSLHKFIGRLKPGGILFVNSSIINDRIERDDITVVEVPVTEMAIEIGNPKILNVIMLGAYVGFTQVISEDVVSDTVIKKLGKKPELIELNKEAFNKGLAIGKLAKAKDAKQ